MSCRPPFSLLLFPACLEGKLCEKANSANYFARYVFTEGSIRRAAARAASAPPVRLVGPSLRSFLSLVVVERE
jgi:hypothetical protein